MITLEEIDGISPKKVSQTSIDAFKRFMEVLSGGEPSQEGKEDDE